MNLWFSFPLEFLNWNPLSLLARRLCFSIFFCGLKIFCNVFGIVELCFWETKRDGEEEGGGTACVPWPFTTCRRLVLQSDHSGWVLSHQCQQRFLSLILQSLVVIFGFKQFFSSGFSLTFCFSVCNCKFGLKPIVLKWVFFEKVVLLVIAGFLMD